MVLGAGLGRLIFQGQLLHKQCVRIVSSGELKRRASWDMEVQSEECPLSLSLGRHGLNRRYMKRHEYTLSIIWNEYGVVYLVHIYEARFEVLGKLFLICVCLYVLHLLDLLLFSPTLYLPTFIPLPELLNLPILQLTLRLLPRLLLLFDLEILRPQACGLNLIGVDMPAHVD